MYPDNMAIYELSKYLPIKHLFWTRKRHGDVSFTHPKPMLDRKRTDNYHFWGLDNFMSPSLLFELLIVRNKTSSP